MLTTALLLLQVAQPTHNGRANDLAVMPPRLEAPAVADGFLNEPVWQRAAMLTGFSQYRPVDGRAAVDSTEVLVWYAPDAIWFGIRAWEPHGQVRATLADRDNIDGDDYVQILLDTFNDRRRALVIGVNPLGVQADGMRTEGGGGGAGGPGAGGRFENVDLNPDFVFESRGRLTEWGYEVEIRVPFKSIRYQAADPQTWSINVIRKIQHSGYEDTWTPAVRASASFLAQSGTLEGLTDLQRGLVLDLNPFATGRALGARDATSGRWEYDVTPEIGLNATWGITTNLTLDATINPDFSQVEADVGQVTVNERFAVRFPEKRPFFLEGIDQFSTPNTLIYTRRIVNPIGGAKLTGKVGATSIGVLSAVDDQPASATGTDYPVVNALRLRQDLGGQSTAGLVYTDRIDGDDWNRVAGADARLVFGRMYFVEAQLAGSATRAGGTTSTAPLWEVTFDRTGRSWGFNYQIKGIHEDFRARSGFVNRTGILDAHAFNRLTLYGAPGAFVENWTGFFRIQPLWLYDDFFAGRDPLELAIGHTTFLTLRGGWGAQFSPVWASVAFDPAFFADYFVDTGTDTVAFVTPDRLQNLVGVEATVSTPQFSSFAASLSGGLGEQAGFFEGARVRTLSGRATVEWRPTDQIRVEARYVYAALDRDRDGTRLSTANIPRVKLEYQVSRPLFVRFVGQYDAQERDALRDPRTDDPLLRCDGGTCTALDATATNDLRVDWLVSFRPNPGTVIFAGYGASLTETDAFAFRQVARTQDGFFVKLSYLFRL